MFEVFLGILKFQLNSKEHMHKSKLINLDLWKNINYFLTLNNYLFSINEETIEDI